MKQRRIEITKEQYEQMKKVHSDEWWRIVHPNASEQMISLYGFYLPRLEDDGCGRLYLCYEEESSCD